jgi:hypothetical protein
MSFFPIDAQGTLAPVIVGASDRMITAGDVQFEPQQTKVWGLTASIAIMIAGDTSLQTEIIRGVQADVNQRIQAEPNNWWKVTDVADLYSRHYQKAVLRRSESAILAPFGLDQASFLSKQQEMAPDLVMALAKDLINFDAPRVETIITGIDDEGAHIVSVENGNWSLQDAVGFAAIGAGYWHANSQLMFAGHTRFRLFPETLLLTYSAKKRAEVAPGVGQVTDMFMIGPAKGASSPVSEDLIRQVDAIHKDT